MNTFDGVTIKATSLGRMLTPMPTWFGVHTLTVIRRELPPAMNPAAGHPWIDSPIFDRLAGERFGK